MNAFHRHLTARFLRNLALTLVVLTATTMALRGGDPGDGILIFLLSAFIQALPVALLVATLFTLGPLARNHEITALKTGGWSLARITWPILAAGAGGTVVAGILDLTGPPGATPDSARPILSFLVVVLGIGLGATPRADTRFAGFLTAMGLLIAFYFIEALFQALGRHGGLPTVVAGWGATILFGVVALTLFRRAEK